MKRLQLWKNDEQKVNGYVNICMFANPKNENDEVKLWSDIWDLDGIISDAEVDEIVVNGVLGHLQQDRVITALDNWTKKLCHGGSLKILDIDAMRICKDFSDYKINIDTLNGILYGTDIVRYNCLEMNGLSNHLTKVGYKIINLEVLDEYCYLIGAEKQ